MSAATAAFVQSLVANIRPLEEILAEHIAYFEEVLPHVFLGDVTRWAERQSTTETSLRRLLDRLEQADAPGVEDVRQLIEVSFLKT